MFPNTPSPDCHGIIEGTLKVIQVHLLAMGRDIFHYKVDFEGPEEMGHSILCCSSC